MFIVRLDPEDIRKKAPLRPTGYIMDLISRSVWIESNGSIKIDHEDYQDLRKAYKTYPNPAPEKKPCCGGDQSDALTELTREDFYANRP